MQIVTLYEQLGSYRAVGKIVGCDHKTVKAIVERHRAPEPGPMRVRRARLTDVVAQVIADKVDETHGKITAKRVLPIVRAAGYAGSPRSLRRRVREAKNRWRAQHHRIYRPWRSAPGEFVICDWGSVGNVMTPAGPRAMSVFCAVLGWSRLRFVWFTISQAMVALAESLHRCFEELDGVPAKVLFDNPKTVTASFVAGAAVLNPDLVRLAAHYRFEIVTCERADPESKGKVEALVRYVKGNVPDGGFASLAEANAWGRAWSEDANAQRHPETCAVPTERFAAEQPLLHPPPALRPAVASGERRKVDRMSTVRVGSARYSAPTTLRGEWVEVSCDGEHLIISHRGVIVATHPMVPPGEASIDDAHYPNSAPTGVRRLRPRTDVERAFLEFGESAEAWLRGAAAAGTTGLHRYLPEILDLVRAHGDQAVQAALARAAAFRRFTAADVRSIIASGASAPPQHDHVAEPLTIPGLPRVPVRDLAAYRARTKRQVAARTIDPSSASSTAPAPSPGLLFDPDAFDGVVETREANR
jgi:transposase